jgi:hypothetical protein
MKKPTRKDLNRMREGFDEFKNMFELASEDVEFFRNKLLSEDNQLWRRAYIRTTFAEIEAMVFRMKQVALKSCDMFGIKLSEAEINLIQEQSFDLRENGEIKTQAKFLRLQSNLRFAFKVFSRVLHFKYSLEVSSDGWTFFDEALRIRNRLTHPKSLSDFHISDQDEIIVIKASDWFKESMKGLLNSGSEGISKYLSTISVPLVEERLESSNDGT